MQEKTEHTESRMSELTQQVEDLQLQVQRLQSERQAQSSEQPAATANGSAPMQGAGEAAPDQQVLSTLPSFPPPPAQFDEQVQVFSIRPSP